MTDHLFQGVVTQVYYPELGRDKWSWKCYLADHEGYFTAWSVAPPAGLGKGSHVQLSVKQTHTQDGKTYREIRAVTAHTPPTTQAATAPAAPQTAPPRNNHDAEIVRMSALGIAGRIIEGSILTVAERCAFVRDVSDEFARYISTGEWSEDLTHYLQEFAAKYGAAPGVEPPEGVKL